LLFWCDSKVLWVDELYQVLCFDNTNNRTLNYALGGGASITRIQAEIIALGRSKRYIVAK
jgi:hypothetical protein